MILAKVLVRIWHIFSLQVNFTVEPPGINWYDNGGGATPLIYSYYSNWVTRIIRTILTHGEYSITLVREPSITFVNFDRIERNWDVAYASPNPGITNEIGDMIVWEGGISVVCFRMNWATPEMSVFLIVTIRKMKKHGLINFLLTLTRILSAYLCCYPIAEA